MRKIIVIILLLICVLGVFFSYPFIYSNICKKREYKDIAQKVTKDILSANLYIIKQETDGQGTGYSPGFGGVVFKQDGNKYYALTAYHAVDFLENTNLIILTYGDTTYNEYAVKHGMGIGLSKYYESFPQGSLEYFDDKYDLAIISFESEIQLKVLDIFDDKPQYGSRLAVISSPAGENRNFVSYGKVVSKKPVEFGDERGKTQYKVIRHSAYENEGSSGSAVLNEECEIIGINLGGGTDILGNFKYGLAMPGDGICDFIEEWNNVNATQKRKIEEVQYD